jgi:tRNA (mo5U34)-methyltransferase
MPPSDDLPERVAALPWYHQIELAPGVRTPGVNDPSLSLARLGLPEDLSGRTVLDIGAWDGAWSFEAERRGAKRVLATDSYSWTGAGWGSKESFELAREALGSSVEDRTIDVFDLSPESVGTFDLVLFLGVLYHLKDPIGALERVASVADDMAIVETEVDLMLLRRPAAAFYPATELNADPTNWWGPNPAAVAGALRAVGFSRVTVAWKRPLPARFAGWVRHLRGPERRPLLDAVNRHRAVFHAWKT